MTDIAQQPSMSKPFLFPPPPPPPPRTDSRSHAPNQYASSTSTGGRGSLRGDGRGSFAPRSSRSGPGQGARGRGYGGTRGRGNNPGIGRERYMGDAFRHAGSQHQSHEAQTFNSSSSPSIPSSSKRNHASAFGNSNHSSRPKAAPAVPSFNADLDNLLTPRKKPEQVRQPAQAKRSNLLGLTPSTKEIEAPSDEEDVDDEGKLAATGLQDGDTFNHNGQTLSLRSPEEIASWIAERKRKYPTKAKVEAARREAEEKKRQWEQRKKEREEATRLRAQERTAERKEQEKLKVKQHAVAEAVARSKADFTKKDAHASSKTTSEEQKLRKRVERATRQLREAEEALAKAKAQDPGQSEMSSGQSIARAMPVHPTQVIDGGDSSLQQLGSSKQSDDGVKDGDADSSHSSDVDTSSSGSSDSESASESDSGSAPEVSSSRLTGPQRVSPEKVKPTILAEQRPCRDFVRSGKCKFGNRCRYSHKIPRKEPKSGTTQTPFGARRKGLYEIMVEKEQEEQQKIALRAIISLGQQGLLEDDAEMPKTERTSPLLGVAVGDSTLTRGDS